MKNQKYIVKDVAGLHARPASILTAAAARYKGDVDIIYKDKSVTLKSIMSVMSLGIPHQATFYIEVTGEKEEEQLGILTNILSEHKIIW